METRPFDPDEYLDREEAIEAYLADARGHGDQDLADAAEVVVRARVPPTRESDLTAHAAKR